MSADDELRERIAQLGRAQVGGDAKPAGGSRPARPAAPTISKSAVARTSPPTAPPQAPQLSNVPARPAAPPTARPVAPAISTPQALAPLIERPALGGGRVTLSETLLPPCLTLGVTLPLLGAGWFGLDRFSMLRATGVWLPIALFAVGAIFATLATLLWVRRSEGTPSV